MSKNLQNRLQWLEEELFEEEDLTGLDQEVSFDGEDDFDLDALLDEFREEEPAPRQRPSQNRAADYGRMAFTDETLDDSTAVLVTRKKSKKQAEDRPRSNKGLVVLAILEVIAILAVLLRWALWFL